METISTSDGNEITLSDGYDRPGHGETLALWVSLRSDHIWLTSETTRRPGDGVPLDVWHGVEFGIDINPYEHDLSEGRTHVDPASVVEYLEGDGGELLDRIIAGGEMHWDGSNHVGRLDANAEAALTELSNYLDGMPTLNLVDWTCDEWFGQCMSELYALSTDEEARDWGNNSDDPHIVLDQDPGDWCAREWRTYHADD